MSKRRTSPLRLSRIGTLTGLALAMALAGAGTVVAAGAHQGGPAGWSMAGQNINDTHFQADEHKITPANVNQLTARWQLTTAGAVSAVPTVAEGVVYVPDYGGKLWAVDAQSGQVRWSHSISDYTGVPGDVSRTSPTIVGGELILGDGWILNSSSQGAHVFAVDRRTGRLLWSTQVDTNSASVITGSPVVYDGVAYLGISSKGEGVTPATFRGAVIAVDVRTGNVLWKAYMVPSNNGGGDSNLPGYYTGNAVFSSTPVVDPARGLLYVGTGNNYSVPPGVCTSPAETDCTPSEPDNYQDSIVALRLNTGAVAWADHTLSADLWTIFQPDGPDFDFAAGPNLFTTTNPTTGESEQLLGIGQKSGVYWAVEPGSGKVVWQTVVGPAGNGGTGGVEWGSATDGRRIYVAEADSTGKPYTLQGSGPYAGQTVTGGSWAALDPATGKILWQTPDPQGAFDTSFVSVANGVVYGGSLATQGNDMFALDASNGTIMWGFPSGGSVSGGAAIANGSVYWGSGYCGAECLVQGTPLTNNDKMFAFGLR